MNPQDDLRSVLAAVPAKWRNLWFGEGKPMAWAEGANAALLHCADELEAALLHGGGGEAVACVISLGANDWNPYELLDLARLHVTSPDAGDQLLLGRIKECLLQQKRCQSTPPPQPRGDMVLVPREPTDEMQRAGCNAYLDDMKGGLPRFAATYRAMLAAAPGEGSGE